MRTDNSKDERQQALLWVSEYRTAVAETERRERQILSLYELWRSTASTNRERLLQHITERVTTALDAHTCSLLLRDRGGDTLRMVASVGFPQDVADSVTLLVGERIAGRVAASGQPVLINKDPNVHPLLSTKDSPQPIKRRDEVESSLCAPLTAVDGEIHGVLCVSRLTPATPFDETDLKVFSLFAAQTGAIIAQQRIVEDLTRKAEEATQMEREMAQNSHLASLGQFAATVAHELRNPLSSIKGAAQFLLREFGQDIPDDDERGVMLRDFLTIVVEEVNGLGQLTTDLLDFARPTPPSRQRCDLTDMVRNEVSFMIPELASIGVEKVHQHYEPLPPAWVALDSKQLGQALRNLILNAAQAAVAANDGNGAEVHISLQSHPYGYEIAVQDNGNGVPEEIGQRLWDPFFTTKARGSGLGLAQVRRVIEAHGGRVNYANIPNSGARFAILLPRLEARNHTLDIGDLDVTELEGFTLIGDEKPEQMLEEADIAFVPHLRVVEGGVGNDMGNDSVINKETNTESDMTEPKARTNEGTEKRE